MVLKLLTGFEQRLLSNPWHSFSLDCCWYGMSHLQLVEGETIKSSLFKFSRCSAGSCVWWVIPQCPMLVPSGVGKGAQQSCFHHSLYVLGNFIFNQANLCFLKLWKGPCLKFLITTSAHRHYLLYYPQYTRHCLYFLCFSLKNFMDEDGLLAFPHPPTAASKFLFSSRK